jgi:prolyl 4-hydroxylase
MFGAWIDARFLPTTNNYGSVDMTTAHIKQLYPNAQRVPTSALELFQIRQFVDSESCKFLVEMIEAQRRPSTITDDNGDPEFRTSETCDLFPTDPLVAALDNRLAALIGVPSENGEIMQGQRYLPGQEFKPHTDWFEPTGVDYAAHCAVRGQRTWTAMIYLNEPEAGGATRFRTIDKIFRPETGKLLLWNNLDRNGRPNSATLHQGMKVRAGRKYIITKWFRERADAV